MENSRELEGGNVRASDRDRTKVANELRAHCADGRITVAELEIRVERAMTAETIHELAVVVCDLPVPSLLEQEPGYRTRVGPPGIRPFTRRIVVPVRVDRARSIALDTIAAGLNRLGYELTRQSSESMEFRRNRKEWIIIDFEPHETNSTTMVVHGRASRKIRRSFVELAFG